MLKTVFMKQCLAVDLVYHLFDICRLGCILLFFVLFFLCAALCESTGSLASCLIYAKPLGHPFRAFIEYICGCVLFQDVTVREIRER